MSDPGPILLARLTDAAFVPDAIARVRAARSELPVLFPQLPRRVGRDVLGGGRTTLGGGSCDLDGWRRCDAAAAALLLALPATETELLDLHAHGDIEERTMLLRALAVLPPSAATVRLLGEVQRTNMVVHLEAAVCDSDLVARLRGQHGFLEPECNRLLLKVAFLDLPLARIWRGPELANPELSRMLQDLATEREAAGRAVWRDTWRLLGKAPTQGSVARLIGGLEHGDDGVRLAAAEGLLALGRRDLGVYARERLPREPRAPIRALLQRLAD